MPAYFNTCDPTFDICSAIKNPEEVAGPNGSLVYVADILPTHLVSNNPQAVPTPSTGVNPEVVPFYRDDACFDDGTGDAPVQRPYPGDASTDPKVENGYVSYWQNQGAPVTQYSDLTCAPPHSGQTGYQQAGFDTYNTMPFQGAIGEFGLHFFFTADSDNLFGPLSVTEVDAEQWTYAVPSATAANLISPDTSVTPAGQDYGLNVVAPLQATVTPFSAAAAPSVVPESPLIPLLPVAGLALAISIARSPRRPRSGQG